MEIRKAIVVGASSGIGAAIARQLAAEGADVAILGRREAQLHEVARDNAKLRVYEHDVEQTDTIAPLWERIVEELGDVDTVVYAAGVLHIVDEHEYDFDKDRQMVAVNLIGAIAWLNLAAARFEAKKRGNIVGISSVAGERGRRGNPAYCTSKAALSTYLESLRNRCSRYGVNVVTAKPGFVDTEMTRGKPVFWLISPERAADETLALVKRNDSANGFVPSRWALLILIVRLIPSFLFRRLNV